MINNIIFDFDGTLVDTSEGIIKSMHYAFDKLNIPRVTDQEIRGVIGPPLPRMLEILLKTNDDELVLKCTNYFRERYSNDGLRELEMYPGVSETLINLYEEDINLYIVTSKPHMFVIDITEKLQMINYFKDISGIMINGKDLNKANRIERLVNKHELIKEETIMVGDRCEDIIAAKYNDIKCIGVNYGYGKNKDLLEEGACLTINSLKDILNYIRVSN